MGTAPSEKKNKGPRKRSDEGRTPAEMPSAIAAGTTKAASPLWMRQQR